MRCRSTEFAATQDGTLHFQHLKNVDGGLLHLADTLDEHVAQLARLPVDGEAGRQQVRALHPGVRAPARTRRGRDAARGGGHRRVRRRAGAGAGGSAAGRAC